MRPKRDAPKKHASYLLLRNLNPVSGMSKKRTHLLPRYCSRNRRDFIRLRSIFIVAQISAHVNDLCAFLSRFVDLVVGKMGRMMLTATKADRYN